ncbi:hypothetical protein ACFX11_038399 [Malus domestica]
MDLSPSSDPTTSISSRSREFIQRRGWGERQVRELEEQPIKNGVEVSSAMGIAITSECRLAQMAVAMSISVTQGAWWKCAELTNSRASSFPVSFEFKQTKGCLGSNSTACDSRNRWSSPTRPRRIHFGGFDLSLLKFDPESSGGAWRSPLTLMAVAVDSVRVNRISNSEGPSEHKATFEDEWAWQYYSLPTV